MEGESNPGKSLPQEKQALREAAWALLQERRAALFPGPRGRIPNFRGASPAAELLADTAEWKAARVLKCNPDSPQRPVRLRALREGKTVYMAVPRLRALRCFWELDPTRIEDLASASTIRGAARYGRPVHPREIPHVDLIVAGSVAVTPDGVRLGKGGGYSDLEYAIGRTVGCVDDTTKVATTVHPLQLVPDLPWTRHDFLLDLVVTPEEVIRPHRRRHQPSGILPEDLTAKLRRDIPILADLGF